ncbi:MAG: helix-turn-helix transcriptional regulator, partial [Dehalococcoidia bacterium]
TGPQEAAAALVQEGLQLHHELDDRHGVADALAACARLAEARGDVRTAGLLFGAANALRDTLGAPLAAPDRATYDPDLALLQDSTDESAFAEAWQAGHSLTIDAAVAVALSAGERASEPARYGPRARGILPTANLEGSATARPAGLSRREAEVLALIASGCSNREIATELVLSERTVGRHITNIYAKIGARSKVDAAAFALRHGLAAVGP